MNAHEERSMRNRKDFYAWLHESSRITLEILCGLQIQFIDSTARQAKRLGIIPPEYYEEIHSAYLDFKVATRALYEKIAAYDDEAINKSMKRELKRKGITDQASFKEYLKSQIEGAESND